MMAFLMLVSALFHASHVAGERLRISAFENYTVTRTQAVLAEQAALDIWGVTFNLGDLATSPRELDVIMRKLAHDALDAGVRMVVIAMQEVSSLYLPPTQGSYVPPGGWTVYRVSLAMSGTFSMQTLIMTRGLSVRTRRILDAQLPPNTVVSQDPGAPGCQRGQPHSNGCWSYSVVHETHAVYRTIATACNKFSCSKDNAPASMASKATVVTMFEVLPEKVEYADHGTRYLAWTNKAPWSAQLVVSNSHFGAVATPLGKMMFKRTKQLEQAVRLVDAVSKRFTLPVLMLGDWNFRMSPHDHLSALFGEHNVPMPTKYTGPAIMEFKPDEELDLVYLESSSMNPKAFYDEVSIGLALGAPSDTDFFEEPSQERKPWKRLVDAGVRTRSDYSMTCRYETPRDSLADPVPVKRGTFPHFVETSDGKAASSWLSNFTAWDRFLAAGHSFKPVAHVITRAPSMCDRLFWSAGLQKDALTSTGPFTPWLPEDGNVRHALIGTDHLITKGGFSLKSFDSDALKRRKETTRVSEGWICCCPLEHQAATGTNFVVTDTCQWRRSPSFTLGSGCNAGRETFSYHTIHGRAIEDGAEMIFQRLLDAFDPQSACEAMAGDIFEFPVGKDKKRQRFVMDDAVGHHLMTEPGSPVALASSQSVADGVSSRVSGDSASE